MDELTGTTLEKYGISILPKAIRFPENPDDREFCETCGHDGILHNIRRRWNCRLCPECPEFMSDGLRTYIEEKRTRKIFGRTLPLEIRTAVLARDGMVCYFCRHRLHTRRGGPHKLHFDHLTPFSMGGNHDLSNVVACCLECNLSKHDRTELEFWEMRRQGLGCQRNMPTGDSAGTG